MEPFDRYANELNLNMDASSYLDNISARRSAFRAPVIVSFRPAKNKRMAGTPGITKAGAASLNR
jgi:hypothetical protein